MIIKNHFNKGVTLFALVLTIAVSLILVTASIGAITNVVANNRISGFVEEMTEIERQVELYYIENNSVPSNGAVLDKSKLMYLVNLYNKDNTLDFEQQLQDEMNLNGDNNAISYHKLDLSKINIGRTFKENDIYVIAYPSLHVYYLKGMTAKRNVYFSVSSRINGGIVIRNNEVTNISRPTIVTENNGIKVTKKTGTWSNKLGITINTYMQDDEKLYVAFNEKEVLLNTNGGQENNISFDNLLSNVQGGLLVSSSLTSQFNNADMESLSSVSPELRYIEIIKKDSLDKVIAKCKVNTFNFDYVLPKLINQKTEINSLEENNEVTFYAEDLQSGVKEIRYEYSSTYDRDDGNTGKVAYYSGNEINKEYLTYRGKIEKADASGKVKITLPKGVSSIKLVVVDNTNNVSDMVEVDTVPADSVYYSISSISKDSISIMLYGDNITSGTLVYGPDNRDYSDSIRWEAKRVVVLNNLSKSSNKLYIKVNTSKSTRIIVLDMKLTNTNLGTNSKSASTWNNPYIPNGFIHIEGTIEEGFVIQDISNTSSKYNEFVWIPVDNTNVKFGKEEFGVGTIASYQNVFIDNINSYTENSIYKDKIEESVEKYGGFYVARYEASKDDNGNVRSIKNAVVWNNIDYNQALQKCNTMYSSKSDIKTTIMSSATYDTIMKWLSYSKYNVTTSSDTTSMIGNFSASILSTGSNPNYAMNNIYDLAGNVAEITSESYKSYPVFRGGAYSSTGENRICSVRAYNNSSHILDSIGFRPIMYII